MDKQKLEDKCKFFWWCKNRDKFECSEYESFKKCSYYKNYLQERNNENT